ncbi:hypothetical protein EI94DRAFT_1703657 [Lactarius quietus]|nr:hypothetical protein EI94DRAFT_1703657 [Lactarius quietus]
MPSPWLRCPLAPCGHAHHTPIPHPPNPPFMWHPSSQTTLRSPGQAGGHAGTGLGAPISGRVRWEASAPRRLWSLPNNLSTNIEQPVKQNEQLFDNNNNAKRRKSRFCKIQ